MQLKLSSFVAKLQHIDRKNVKAYDRIFVEISTEFKTNINV